MWRGVRGEVRAFTLVELIVVIVILSILATIAFLSFNSYSWKARDGNRLSNLKLTEKWLELSYISMWTYLMPEWTISTWTVNSVDVVYKWIVWNNISNIIKLSSTPKDPLTNDYITYWLTFDKTKYQLAVTLEESSSVSSDFNNDILQIDKANSDTVYQAKVIWNYVWNIKFSSWSTTKIHYLANIPSLIFNFSWSTTTDLLSWTTVYYVVNKNTNLPYRISWTTTSTNNKNWNTIIQEVTNKTNATLTWVDITTIVNTTDSTARTNLINSTFSWVLLNSFWWDINVVTASVSAGTTTSSASSIIKTWNWSWTTTVPYTYKEDSTTIYPKSCNDILISTWTSFNSSNISSSVTYNWANASKFKDWMYTINPSWVNWSQFDVYCDMTNNAWWRTLGVRIINSQQHFATTAVWTFTSYDQASCWKLSDANINLIPKTVWIKLDCWWVTYTFSKLCVFAAWSSNWDTNCHPGWAGYYGLNIYPNAPQAIYWHPSVNWCHNWWWSNAWQVRLK